MPQYYVPLVATPQNNSGGGGGSDLPAVSAADNGDVLTVVNGAWDKAAPGGGGGVLVVRGNPDNLTTLDKTYNEIFTALSAGTPVMYHESGEDYTQMMWVVYVGEDDGTYSVYIWDTYNSTAIQYIAASADGYPEYIEPGD